MSDISDAAANTNTRKAKGNQGEVVAQALLERRGYRIVDVNVCFGSRRDGLPGEIDIIAWDGPTLCFVEVKTRRQSAIASARGAVTATKQRQIARLALAYAAHYGLLDAESDSPLRFDVVAVTLAPERNDMEEARIQRTELLKGAFLAPDNFDEGF